MTSEIFFVDAIPGNPQFVVRGTAPQVVGAGAGTYKLYNTTAIPVEVTVTGAVTAPGAPTGLTATAGVGQVSLAWTAPASNGGAPITDYRVEYSANDGVSWSTFSDGVSTATTAAVTGLTAGAAYLFRVSAINSAGTGAASATATATPTAATTLSMGAQLSGPLMGVSNGNRFTPSGAAGCNTRAPFVARAAMTKVKLLFVNTIQDLSNSPVWASSSAGGTMVINAVSIEYPAGTFTPVKFGGLNGVTIADKGFAETDLTSVAIPAGATFWVRTFCGANTSGKHGLTQFPSGGGNWEWSDTDKTLGGSISGTGYAISPYVFGDAAGPTIAVVGDSIAAGWYDTANSYGQAGVIAKSLPTDTSVFNFAQGGKKFTDLISGWASFVGYIIQTYATHVVGNLGANGYASISEANTFWGNAIFANATRIQCTVTPKTSSTDSWATLGNQTVTLDHTALNAAIKAKTVGADDFFDVAASLADSGAPTKWKVGGPYTGDGLHPNLAGYNKVVSDGVITLSKLGL